MARVQGAPLPALHGPVLEGREPVPEAHGPVRGAPVRVQEHGPGRGAPVRAEAHSRLPPVQAEPHSRLLLAEAEPHSRLLLAEAVAGIPRLRGQARPHNRQLPELALGQPPQAHAHTSNTWCPNP